MRRAAAALLVAVAAAAIACSPTAAAAFDFGGGLGPPSVFRAAVTSDAFTSNAASYLEDRTAADSSTAAASSTQPATNADCQSIAEVEASRIRGELDCLDVAVVVLPYDDNHQTLALSESVKWGLFQDDGVINPNFCTGDPALPGVDSAVRDIEAAGASVWVVAFLTATGGYLSASTPDDAFRAACKALQSCADGHGTRHAPALARCVGEQQTRSSPYQALLLVDGDTTRFGIGATVGFPLVSQTSEIRSEGTAVVYIVVVLKA